MEVYIHGMMVKIVDVKKLIIDLRAMFDCLRKHNMRLNSQKCAFKI